jgi:hypothetical protein
MARRHAQLVCQHLENVSRKVLERYQGILRGYVRGRHGVYALYRRSKLHYVGLVFNLFSRLNQHLRDRHAETWDRFSIYLTIADSHLKELESLVLRIASPRGNREKGTFARSDDLRGKFRRDIAVAQRSELESLFEGSSARKPAEKSVEKEGRRPTLAPFVKQPFMIRFRYKGKRYVGRVRTDGKIRFLGRLFNSPSLAAMAVAKRAMNGWTTWEYERAPGDWVLLDELRKK